MRRHKRTKKQSTWIWWVGVAILVIIVLPAYTNSTAHQASTNAPVGQSTSTQGTSTQAPKTQVRETSAVTKTIPTSSTSAGIANAAKGSSTTGGSNASGLSPNPNQAIGWSSSTAQLAEQAFTASHAKMASTEVHSWALVNQKFESTSALREIANNVQKDFHMQQAKTLQRTDKGEHFYEIYGQRASGAQASIIVSSFEFPNAPSQTILVIRDDSQQPNTAQLTAEYKQIAEAQRRMGLTPQISACIKGFTNAKISGGLIVQLENEVFQAVQAKRIEGINTHDVTSISGYSPKSANFIMTNHQRMNLQLGLHYDDQTNETEVIVGAPYITITY